MNGEILLQVSNIRRDIPIFMLSDVDFTEVTDLLMKSFHIYDAEKILRGIGILKLTLLI